MESPSGPMSEMRKSTPIGAPVAALNCYEAAALEAWHMLNGGRIDEGEFVKLAIGAAHSCGGMPT